MVLPFYLSRRQEAETMKIKDMLLPKTPEQEGAFLAAVCTVCITMFLLSLFALPRIVGYIEAHPERYKFHEAENQN